MSVKRKYGKIYDNMRKALKIKNAGIVTSWILDGFIYKEGKFYKNNLPENFDFKPFKNYKDWRQSLIDTGWLEWDLNRKKFRQGLLLLKYGYVNKAKALVSTVASLDDLENYAPIDRVEKLERENVSLQESNKDLHLITKDFSNRITMLESQIAKFIEAIDPPFTMEKLKSFPNRSHLKVMKD